MYEDSNVTEVVSVKFNGRGKAYYFDANGLTVKPGQDVIVETSKGLEYAQCVAGNHYVSNEKVVPPIRPVIRIATDNDKRVQEINHKRESEALDICRGKVAEHGLDMKLVDVECSFEGNKITFYFTSDGRVDFRELVKDLAGVFRSRIELRQIGVRDEAKMLGGLGMCGRPFCCSQFLTDFQPVSTKMAKTQGLSLNPTKISGTCGRLMCCLKYEQEAYEDLLKTSPKNESFVDTVDGRGTVVDVNLLKQTVRVRMEDAPDTINTYKNTEIVVLRNGKAKKNDPPIPKDLAPLSSLPKIVKKREPMPEALPEVMFQGESLTAEKPAQPPVQEAAPQRSRRRRRKPQGERPEGQKPAEKPAEKPQKAEKPDKPRQEKKPRPEGESAPAGETPHRRRRRRGRGGSKPGGTPPEVGA